MKIILFALLTFITSWCSFFKPNKKEPQLASVGNEILYISDIKGLIKPGLNKTDSLIMLNSLVEKWVRKQLIVQKAELNLSENEKDVAKELEEYRTSLIIFKYEQKFIKEKLDTVVNEKDIEQYYKENTQNFTLSYDIVQAQYLKLPLKAPNLEKVKNWLKSDNAEDMKQLEGYCFQYAIKYDYFNEKWINFDNIRMLLPVKLPAEVQNLRNNQFIDVKDSVYQYFVYVKKFQPKSSIAPFKYIEGDIQSIILLKRKQKLITDIENRIYFDALNKNNFTIFNKQND